jgi:hypothetical protein
MAGPQRWLAGMAVVAVLAAWTAGAADAPTPATPSDPPPRMPRADGEPATGPDGLELPPDAKAVVLPREKYQELLDELARLREQQKPGKPLVPSFCELSGQVDGDLVRLRAQFKFRTERDNQRVVLGCSSGNPTEAKLDGQLPNLTKTADNGFVVQVEKAGEREFQLDLEIPIVGKENDRSFALDLPGAAVTTLELDLPEGVKAARIGPDTFKAETLENKRNRVKGPLGPLTRLEVAWTPPESGTPRPPLLSADTRITVRVEETQVVTEAELTLKPLQGEPAEWLLQVPPQAELKKQGLDERIQSVEVVDPKRSVRVLKLTGPSAKELKVAFRVSQPRESKPIPVGPFAAPAAARQQGTLVISAPSNVSITCHPHGDLNPRPVTEEERRRDPNAVAAFRYANLPGLEKPLIDLNQPLAPLLDLTTETIKGEVEARVRHDLRLVKPDGENRPFWRLTTTIEGTAYRTRAEHLLVRLPPGFQFDDSVGVQPAEFVQGPEINPATHVAQFTLLNKKPERFQVTFQGSYPAVGEEERAATLELPQPLGVLDRGGVVTLAVPEDWKLLPPKLPGAREPMILEPHKQTWRYEKAPARIGVEWQSTRAELPPPVKSTSTPGVLHVTRALIQVTVGSSGYQNYWGWFQVKTAGNKTLDVKFPAPLTALNLRVFVDGKPAQPVGVDESGMAAEAADIARIPIGTAGESGQAVVKVEYQLPPGRTGGSGLLQTALQPPVMRGDPGWYPVRWLISLPSSWLPLDADSSFRAEQDWKIRGWLLGPRAVASGADSEGWSFGAEAAGLPATPEGDTKGPLALVGWQNAPGPLRLTHAPQQGWLLACSLTVLALGLAVGLLKWPRGLGWLVALGGALAAAALGLLRPQLLAALAYGIEPGLLVLALVLAMQWLLHQRYRRQVVFLPGFQRGKPGSSIQRVGSSNRPRGEPTTVDAPPPVDSGPRAAGSGVKGDGSVAKAAGDSRNR